MLTINTPLSGRLKVDGYGRGNPSNGDGTFYLSLAEGSAVADVIQRLSIPALEVSLTMVNARQCPPSTTLQQGDRVILIPPDVAALWRSLGQHNMGAGSVFDFSGRGLATTS